MAICNENEAIMTNLFLLFSHSLTPDQVEDAKQSLGVSNFVSLPADLQALFSCVPPAIESLRDYVVPIQRWLVERVQPTDFVLIQGDFGVTFLLVHYCLTSRLGIPVYATTQRQSIDIPQPDGSVVTQRVFRHCCFRRYEQ
jgi:hypothetical protein